MISPEQIVFIENEIQKGRIINPLLKEDLLDHICCLVEEEMAGGASFKEAYAKAYQQTSPNGYSEIQLELRTLLYDLKLMIVNNFAFLSGYLFSAAVVTGLLLRFLNHPGAFLLIASGAFGLMFVFLPLFIIKKLRH